MNKTTVLSLLVFASLVTSNLLGQSVAFNPKSWDQLVTLQNKNLPKSIIVLADSLYNDAKNSGIQPLMIKAAIFKCNAIEQINEQQSVQHISFLANIEPDFNIIGKAVINSLIAEKLWQYYNYNQWRILNNSFIDIVFNNNELDNHDSFIDKITFYYNNSIKNINELKKININQFADIIENGTIDQNIRPTLYDLLVNRALLFYTSGVASLTDTKQTTYAETFTAYPTINEFVNAQLNPNLFSTTHFNAATLYQTWLKFRLTVNDNKKALYFAHYQWLNFIHNTDKRPVADSIMLNSLIELTGIYKNNTELLSLTYYKIARLYYQISKNNTQKNRDKNYQLRINAHMFANKALTISSDSTNTYDIKNLINEIEKPEIGFLAQESVLPEKPFSIKLNYQNVDTVYLKVFKINFYNHFSTVNQYHKPDEIFEKQIKQSQLTDSVIIVLPLTDNFFAYKATYWLKGYNKGLYIIALSDNKKFDTTNGNVEYTYLQVSNLTQAQKNNSNKIQITVNNRLSGQPLKNVKADFYQHNLYQHNNTNNIKNIGSSVSNANGEIFFDGAKNNSVSYILSINNDTILFGSPIYIYNKYKAPAKNKAFIFTDRAIYRPGQTVYFKGIILNSVPDKMPIPIINSSINVSLLDANSQKVVSDMFTTNTYGSFNGSFSIPNNAINGQWTLQTDNGQVNISVEDYKRPTYSVKLFDPKNQCKPGGVVKITGNALNYNGTPVKNATVKYNIERKPWLTFSFYGISSPMHVANGTTLTDSAGNFEITFTAPMLQGENLYGNGYSIDAMVTNQSGESQNANTLITVGNNSLQLIVTTPQTVNQLIKHNWAVESVNQFGEHQKTDINLTIYKLISPNKPFYQDIWDNCDTTIAQIVDITDITKKTDILPKNWKSTLKPEDKPVYRQQFSQTDSVTFCPDNLNKWAPGIYKTVAQTTDEFGQIVECEKIFVVFNPNSKKSPYPEVWFTHSDITTCEPGTSASVIIGSTQTMFVLFEVASKNNIIHKQWVKINKQTKRFSWPVTDDMRGGFAMNFYAVNNGHVYQHSQLFYVPYTSKQLNIEYISVNNKTKPGLPQTISLKIKPKTGITQKYELTAAMYDMSLDNFINHNWSFNPFTYYNYSKLWEPQNFDIKQSVKKDYRYKPLPYKKTPVYDQINWFMPRQRLAYKSQTNATIQVKGFGSFENNDTDNQELFVVADSETEPTTINNKPNAPNLRSNFAETVLFYPSLITDSLGNVTFNYTMPDNLTTYKLLLLAQSENLDYGIGQQTITAQKEIMAQVFAPRFVTQADTVTFVAKIENITNNQINGYALINFTDALSQKNYNKYLLTPDSIFFTVNANSSTTVKYTMAICDTINILQYSFLAKSNNFTDIEQNTIAVLPRRKLITETMPLWINGSGSNNFEFKNLLNSNQNNSINNKLFVIELTANPVWYAILALPQVQALNNNSTEHTFNTLYANSLGKYIWQNTPNLATYFSYLQKNNSSSLVSPMQKNSELKQTILNETPWVLNAQTEQQQKNQLQQWFDKNNIDQQITESVYKLLQTQNPQGWWPWFTGMSENRYITQHITKGLLQLVNCNAIDYNIISPLLKNAVNYLDNKIIDDYNKSKLDKQAGISVLQADYLYTRYLLKNNSPATETANAISFYSQLAKKQWPKLPKNAQALLAVYFYNTNDTVTANAIIESIKQHALFNTEMGMYWKENVAGYGWYNDPIAFQCTIIDAFTQTNQPTQLINQMKIWLLKHKQTNHWKTTKQTTAAIYALLNNNKFITDSANITIKTGNTVITPQQYKQQAEPVTGYFKQTFNSDKITPQNGNITIEREGNGVSWGGAYWQYFTDVASVSQFSGGLSIDKTIAIETDTHNGKKLIKTTNGHVFNVGQTITVVLTITTDREMDYVQIKDNRPACFEPVYEPSGYNYVGSIGYYQTTTNAAKYFYIEHLPKGTFTLRYTLNVTHKGSFTAPPASVQCYYAPEFSAGSKGSRIIVE